MILILPMTKIFVKIYACNLVSSLELTFSYYFAENSVKIARSYAFLAENQFLPILNVYFQYVKNFKIALTLSRHSDIIRRCMILILVAMEKRRLIAIQW